MNARRWLGLLGIGELTWAVVAAFIIFGLRVRGLRPPIVAVLVTFFLAEVAWLYVVEFAGGAQYFAETARPTSYRWLILHLLGIRATLRNRTRHQRAATLFRFSVGTAVLVWLAVKLGAIR